MAEAAAHSAVPSLTHSSSTSHVPPPSSPSRPAIDRSEAVAVPSRSGSSEQLVPGEVGEVGVAQVH